MALDPIKLDDLSWSEMVVAARRRIAAASGGRWTLHAPVDPGITLIELFSWQLEQRLFWMDQVPDALVQGAVTLLGETPNATQVAATVMHFPPPDRAQALPSMTEVILDPSTPPLIFSTDNEIALLPFEKSDLERERIDLFIDGKQHTADLDANKVPQLFPANGGPGEVQIVLWLHQALTPDVVNKRISLLFDLRTPSGIAPQWSPDAPAHVPPPAKLTWYYRGAHGKQTLFAADEVDDGTAGLRRKGVVTLPIKSDWQPESSDAAQSRYPYAFWIRVGHANFSAPPRLERLIPNVVIASHRRKTVEHSLKRDWLPLPGNVIALADLPENKAVKDHPPIENTVKLQIKERDDEFHAWELTSDLAFHGPKDRVFVVDRQRGELRFGDGLTGRLPVLANNNGAQLKVQYFVGGGSAGNLGASRKWRTDVKFGQPINVVPTEGGTEAETMAAARERVASALKERTRAVTREDYEEITLTTPGIAIKRAHAAVGFHPAYPCTPLPGAVTVFLVPDVSRPDVLSEDSEESDGTLVESAFVAAPVPDPGALAAIRAQLNKRRLVASEVFILAPRYRPIAITVSVETNAADRVKLSEKIKLGLRRFLDPLIGGDTGEGWPFGEPLRPSALLREAQRALENEGSVTEVSVKLLDSPPSDGEQKNQDPCHPSNVIACTATKEDPRQGKSENCKDLPIGAHELVELREAAVNFSRPMDSPGGLR